jgi:hypothetical protein
MTTPWAALILILSCAYAQSIPSDVIDAASDPTDSAARSIHFLRAAHFDPRDASGSPLDRVAPEAREHVISFLEKAAVPELPGALSDTILLGTLTRTQPYLTPSHTRVFTELTFNVLSVFDHAGSAPVDKTLIIPISGGLLRLPNGWIADTRVEGNGAPLHSGGRYVLFLRYESVAQSFMLIKGWELSDGRAVALAPDDLNRAANHISRFNGMIEGDFLSAVSAVHAAFPAK